MTAKDALDAANDAALGERLRRFESRCGPRGSCRREPCERDAGRWSFCPDCLTGDLYLNESIFLAHVPREIWRYELGGYPVLKKWLGYRQANRRDNEPLSLRQLDEFRGIVLRVAALLTLRPVLDAAYETAAAASWSVEELSPDSDQPASSAKVVL
jgi:hypothetical protein